MPEVFNQLMSVLNLTETPFVVSVSSSGCQEKASELQVSLASEAQLIKPIKKFMAGLIRKQVRCPLEHKLIVTLFPFPYYLYSLLSVINSCSPCTFIYSCLIPPLSGPRTSKWLFFLYFLLLCSFHTWQTYAPSCVYVCVHVCISSILRLRKNLLGSKLTTTILRSYYRSFRLVSSLQQLILYL